MGGGGGGGGGFAGGLTRTVGLEPPAGVFPGAVFAGGVFVVVVVFAGALGAAGAAFAGGAFDVVVCPVAVPATSTSAIVHPSSSNEGADRRVFCRLRAGVGLCRIMAARCIARRRPEREGYERRFVSDYELTEAYHRLRLRRRGAMSHWVYEIGIDYRNASRGNAGV